MIKLIEGEKLRFDLKEHAIATILKVEIDEHFYTRTHTERPDWIYVEGTVIYGTAPSKDDQDHAVIALMGDTSWGYPQPYVFNIVIVTQEQYDKGQIAIHISRCKEPLEEFETEYPEAFQEWVGEYIFS